VRRIKQTAVAAPPAAKPVPRAERSGPVAEPAELSFEIDASAAPGNVLPALAGLLLDLVEREGQAEAPAEEIAEGRPPRRARGNDRRSLQ
jgi:hypothetical protein